MLDTYWLNLVCICRIVLIKPNATNVIQIYFFVHFKSLSLMLHKNNAHTYLRLELYWHYSLTLVHVVLPAHTELKEEPFVSGGG